MTFVPLVQAWEQSRQERTPMPGHQRVASIEYETGASGRPATFLEWLLDLGDRDRHDEELDNDEMHDEDWEIGS